MKYKSTIKTKDSGIPWVGKVPTEWEIKANKYVMHKIKDIKDIYENEDILSLSVDGVKVRDLDAGGKMPTTFDGYQKLYKNNLLMCLFDYDVTPCCIGLIQIEGLTSPAYSQFVMSNNNSEKYYYYYYLLLDFTKELVHLSKNLRHSFTETELGQIKVPVPPTEEQNKIANFLDSKCSKIDKIINDINEQIGTLENYKKSLINDLVTGKKDAIEKILNKSFKYYHIHINNPWFKIIPTGWTISKLKYKLLNNDGGMWGSDPINDDDLDAIVLRSTEQTIDGYWKINEPASRYIDNKNNLSYYMIKDKDLLVTKSSGSKLHIGKTTIANKDIEKMHYFYSNFIQRIHTKDEINAKYVWYFMNSNLSREQFVYMQNSTSGIGNINSNDINSLYIVAPPKEDQIKIVNYLDTKFTKINNLINYKKQQLNVIKNYKKSLIFEYVTGKKQV